MGMFRLGAATLIGIALAGSASAATKTVMAYCEVPSEKIVTNAVSVTINVDTTENWYQLIKTISAKIGYKASDTFYAMGINTGDGVNCNFSDPSLEYVQQNKPLDYLMSLPADMGKMGYRLVTVSGFGSPDTPRTNKVASTPAISKPPAKASKTGDVAPPPAPKGPTPNQLKYQRELEAYNARLAEIERIKATTAAKHSADTAAAEAELARHRRELAVADSARRQYEQDLAAHQAQVRAMETRQDREAKVDWREAVVVCTLNPADGQARFGNWRCDGPLQMTYAKLGNPGQAVSAEAIVPLSQACGGARESVRDLGMVGDARLFGCSYGLHPRSTSGFPLDAAAKHGISFVPGRAIYRCPAYKSGCRTQ